jgi:hypothetical protein
VQQRRLAGCGLFDHALKGVKEHHHMGILTMGKGERDPSLSQANKHHVLHAHGFN